ncbi:hypothetical protein EDC01DRAFT_632674 [Geopyxis carbonaria]|nr:hypothetical protein EDC01DRAFT_632674 [Geopyxis carbonaria]
MAHQSPTQADAHPRLHLEKNIDNRQVIIALKPELTCERSRKPTKPNRAQATHSQTTLLAPPQGANVPRVFTCSYPCYPPTPHQTLNARTPSYIRKTSTMLLAHLSQSSTTNAPSSTAHSSNRRKTHTKPPRYPAAHLTSQRNAAHRITPQHPKRTPVHHTYTSDRRQTHENAFKTPAAQSTSQ